MPKVLVAYVRCIDSMHTRLGQGLKFAFLAILGILTIEIVARYVFSYPTPWSVELSMFILGTYFFVGGGYALLRGAHVNMDVLYHRWSPRTRAIVNLATFSLFVVYFVVFIWGGIRNTVWALEHGQHASTLWAPPLAPIKLIITVGAGLLFLEAIAFFIKDLSIARGKPIQ